MGDTILPATKKKKKKKNPQARRRGGKILLPVVSGAKFLLPLLTFDSLQLLAVWGETKK